jgi:uncharacterized protein YjbI with pentapeptide repeats
LELTSSQRGDIVKKPELKGADLRGQDLKGADFREADLSHADLSGVNLSGSELTGANLSFANLNAADFSGANLQRANLKHACLRQADLQNADLTWCDLAGADLEEANLKGTHLDEANLCHANLAGADLSGADLDDARLDHADLEGAALAGATILMSSLAHANLRNASLAAADLGWANLTGAQICDTSFKEATYNFSTVWPYEPPEEVQSRLQEPPPDAILNAEPQGYPGSDGWLVHIGFGPTRFSTADFVAIPDVRAQEGRNDPAGCVYLRFKEFLEVLGDSVAVIDTRLGTRYFLAGINLKDPQDLALYEQLLARRVEPSPFPGGTGGQCAKAARQMRIWFGHLGGLGDG